MGACIYTTDGDWTYTPAPYEQVRDLLIAAEKFSNTYIEVPGRNGNSYFIRVGNVAVVEEELAGHKEEKQ